jgi:hypothetical protein
VKRALAVRFLSVVRDACRSDTVAEVRIAVMVPVAVEFDQASPFLFTETGDRVESI